MQLRLASGNEVWAVVSQLAADLVTHQLGYLQHNQWNSTQSQQQAAIGAFFQLRSASWHASTKKADVAQRFETLRHAGLLFDEPTGA